MHLLAVLLFAVLVIAFAIFLLFWRGGDIQTLHNIIARKKAIMLNLSEEEKEELSLIKLEKVVVYGSILLLLAILPIFFIKEKIFSKNKHINHTKDTT